MDKKTPKAILDPLPDDVSFGYTQLFLGVEANRRKEQPSGLLLQTTQRSHEGSQPTLCTLRRRYRPLHLLRPRPLTRVLQGDRQEQPSGLLLQTTQRSHKGSQRTLCPLRLRSASSSSPARPPPRVRQRRQVTTIYSIQIPQIPTFFSARIPSPEEGDRFFLFSLWRSEKREVSVVGNFPTPIVSNIIPLELRSLGKKRTRTTV
ncbi:hypothetical protein RHGRI_034068 [Rhododendron griersonianum]|uniref:Uncharacterized protein n=1 Tax=Rhododendron griersonianum TaxID=479676 RepID=A0AAV6HZY7_9ERIC|nr:hypothetical protein RHGRI_034068 [Rhododendron griersonianum]